MWYLSNNQFHFKPLLFRWQIVGTTFQLMAHVAQQSPCILSFWQFDLVNFHKWLLAMLDQNHFELIYQFAIQSVVVWMFSINQSNETALLISFCSSDGQSLLLIPFLIEEATRFLVMYFTIFELHFHLSILVYFQVSYCLFL